MSIHNIKIIKPQSLPSSLAHCYSVAWFAGLGSVRNCLRSRQSFPARTSVTVQLTLVNPLGPDAKGNEFRDASGWGCIPNGHIFPPQSMHRIYIQSIFPGLLIVTVIKGRFFGSIPWASGGLSERTLRIQRSHIDVAQLQRTSMVGASW